MTRTRAFPRRSLRGAINAFCRYCIHDPKSGIGTWRQQVDACTARDCPLWPVRPGTTGEGNGRPKKGRFAPQNQRTETN